MSRYFGPHNPLPDGYAQLSLSYDGRYRDVIFDTGSADQSGTYVFQVMPSGEAPTANKIISYWTAEGDSSTMISIWNYAAKPQDATLVLYYSGGQYRIPIHLEARQSYNLDMMTLLKSRAPDPDGNLIPPYIESGSAMLVGPGGELDKMTVVLSASGYNVRNATCFPMCINCGGVVDVTVNGVSLGITQTAQASAEVDMADGSQLEYGGDWTISNSAVASIDGGGTVTGYVAGDAIITYTVLNAPPGTVICYQSDDNVCEDEDWSGEGGVTVYDLTPVIDSITYDTWNAGVPNKGVNINGQHFGANLPTINLSDSSIGITITQHSDTQIVATFTPGANSPTETVNVSVTNNGYGSNAFNGGGVDSGTSGQQTATVDAIPAVAPNIKFNGSDIVGNTQSVVVGQQIALSEDIPSPQNGHISSRSWNVTSGTAIAGYSPSTQSASVTPLAANANSSSYTLYWVYPGNSLTVSYNYTLTNGHTSPTVTATFNVTGPTGGTMSFNPYLTALYPAYLTACASPSMAAGVYMIYAEGAVGRACPGGITSATAVGITFNSPTAYQNASGGAFIPLQLISSNVSNGTAATVGLDHSYPYPPDTLPSNDAPSVYLSPSVSPATRVFNANFFLMWQSNKAARSRSRSDTRHGDLTRQPGAVRIVAPQATGPSQPPKPAQLVASLQVQQRKRPWAIMRSRKGSRHGAVFPTNLVAGDSGVLQQELEANSADRTF